MLSRLPKRGRKTTVLLGAIGLALLIEVSVVLAGAAPPAASFARLVSTGPRPASVVSPTAGRTTDAKTHVIVGRSYKNDVSRPLRVMPHIPYGHRGVEREANSNPRLHR